MKFINKLLLLILVSNVILSLDRIIYNELNDFIDTKLKRIDKFNSLKNLMSVVSSNSYNSRKSKLINDSKDFINCMKFGLKNCHQKLNDFNINHEKLFNIFELDKNSKKNSLVIAALLAVNELKVNELIHNMEEFINYLTAIQAMYRKIPYQNRNHSAELLIKLIFWIRRIKVSEKLKKGPIYDAFIDEAIDIHKRKERLEFLLAITGLNSFYQGLNENYVCNSSYNYYLNKLSGASNSITKIICKSIEQCNDKLFAANEKVSSFVTIRVLSKYIFYSGQDNQDDYKNKLQNIFKSCGKDMFNENVFNLDQKNFIHSLIISSTDYVEDQSQNKMIQKPDYYNDKNGIYQIFMNALDNSFIVTKNPSLSMRLSMQNLCQDISSEYYNKFYESKVKVLLSNNGIFDYLLDNQSKTVLKLKKFYMKIDELTYNILNLTKNLIINYNLMINTLKFELSKSSSYHYKYFKLCVKNNYLTEGNVIKDTSDFNNNYIEFVSSQNLKVNKWKNRIDELNFRIDEQSHEEENNRILKPEYYHIDDDIEEEKTKNFLNNL